MSDDYLATKLARITSFFTNRTDRNNIRFGAMRPQIDRLTKASNL